MAGERRLLLHWDPEIDGAFRRRLERAFGELNLRADDANAVDVDPEEQAPIRVALVSIAGGQNAQIKADIVVLGGPGDFIAAGDAMRLETTDIENSTRRWDNFIGRVREKLGRTSVALTADELEVHLGEARRRAEEAERALATMELERNNALQSAKRSEMLQVAERKRADDVEKSFLLQSSIVEAGAFALSSVPQNLREIVSEARDQAWRARLVAARAAEAADAHPDVLMWKSGISYSGETLNRQPHGHGVMRFGDDAIYRGAFEHGQRAGPGIAISEGHTWTGQWKDNEACGLGLLETPDGRRFEGEVASSEAGEPVRGNGMMWLGSARELAKTLRAATPALPAPG